MGNSNKTEGAKKQYEEYMKIVAQLKNIKKLIEPWESEIYNIEKNLKNVQSKFNELAKEGNNISSIKKQFEYVLDNIHKNCINNIENIVKNINIKIEEYESLANSAYKAI